MTTKFSKGSVWELTEDAAPIPAGCYTLIDRMDELLLFGIEDVIQFGLTKEYSLTLLRPVDRKGARLTTPAHFIDRYVTLMSSIPETPRIGTQGMSFCAIDASLSKKFKKLRRWQQGLLRHSAGWH